MVTIGGNKNLRLVTQATKRDRMNDTVTVPLKNIAWPAHIA
jgi:hypothetical protein